MRNYVFVGFENAVVKDAEGKALFDLHAPEVKAPRNYTNIDKIREYVEEESKRRRESAAGTPIFGDVSELVVCTSDGSPTRILSTNYAALRDFLEANCSSGAHWVGFDMASFGGRLAASAARRGVKLDAKWWVGEKTDLSSTVHGGGSTLDAGSLRAMFSQLPNVQDRKAIDIYIDKWAEGKRNAGGDCLLAVTLGLALGLVGGRA